MSQPHLHNVLKGIRSLSPEYADRILMHLQLSLPDLLDAIDPEATPPIIRQGGTMDVPRFRGGVGPKHFLENRTFPGDVYAVPLTITDSIIDPILVTLRHDPLLFPYFQEGDLVLVTRQPVTASSLQSSSMYLVNTEEGTLVRFLRAGGTRLYLITHFTMEEPRNWGELGLRGRQVGDVVVGRLVWLARHLEERASS